MKNYFNIFKKNNKVEKQNNTVLPIDLTKLNWYDSEYIPVGYNRDDEWSDNKKRIYCLAKLKNTKSYKDYDYYHTVFRREDYWKLGDFGIMNYDKIEKVTPISEIPLDWWRNTQIDGYPENGTICILKDRERYLMFKYSAPHSWVGDDYFVTFEKYLPLPINNTI